MSVSMEERLQRRKLDALKRGVHRVPDGQSLAVSSHVVGIGRAGIGVIAEILRNLEPGAPKFTALAVDIGEQDTQELRALAADTPPDQAEVTIVTLDIPRRADLLAVLRRYPEFLRLEYPNIPRQAAEGAWLPETIAWPVSGGHCSRAVAKAIYGAAYYDGARPMERALRAFARSVDAGREQAVVAVVFGMAGGTGSGVAVDLARHLSNVVFGRRVLVAGIGIAPCDGDPGLGEGEPAAAAMFPVLSELDCLGDEAMGRGVVMACGELFRNPFTAGFLMVPLQPAWLATRNVEAARRRVSHELAALLIRRSGANIWELLRMLNWVAAPSTQHSAARTPWGERWIHLLGYADAAEGSNTPGSDTPGSDLLGPDLRARLGLLPTYAPEFIEMRVADPADAGNAAAAQQLERVFAPDVAPQVVGGGIPGSVQFVLPRVAKTDLADFAAWRAAYDMATPNTKLAAHALLLEQGILLCERSTQLEGMAGASLSGGTGWVAVPYASLRGEVASAPHATPELPSVASTMTSRQEATHAA